MNRGGSILLSVGRGTIRGRMTEYGEGRGNRERGEVILRRWRSIVRRRDEQMSPHAFIPPPSERRPNMGRRD